MTFASKPGCAMCGIVATALLDSTAPTNILWRDDNFTAYRETEHPVSSRGHIVMAFNLHVPSLYSLSSRDLPLLATLRDLATRLLSSISTPTSSFPPPRRDDSRFSVGFITPPFRDHKIPVTDHLHAHAYIEPADQLVWLRRLSYGPLAWYAVDDLIAEIRESVSNNRVKSGYQRRVGAPINTIPEAGARTGSASGEDHSRV